MKPHVRLKVRRSIYFPELPYWQRIVEDKRSAATKFHPGVDAVFSKYQLTVWVAREHKPGGNVWDADELASGLDRIYRIILQEDGAIPQSLIQELVCLPIMEEAQIGAIAEAELPKMHATQMSATTDLRSRQAIDLSEAHQFSEGDPRITAVLDTGVDLNHPEYKDNLVSGYDFVNIIDGAGKFVGNYLGYDEEPEDEVGHGTHVAGIIAAKGDVAPRGVVPNCKIMPVRVLRAMQRGGKRIGGLVDNINSGIKWVIDHGADVINMSLGIQYMGGGLSHKEVVDYAKRKDVSIIAASGNDGQEQLYYPGALPYVIPVGAVDEAGNMAFFSTYGKQVDFVAPGTNIYNTYLKDSYAFSTGTSHASPFVAGSVALLKFYALKKKGICLADNQIKHVLQHTVDELDTRFKHRKAGFGKLNLIDALKLLDYKLS